MDFEKLLHVARKNELSKKEPVKFLSAKFKPPTKEQREKDKTLSEGVKRFLARKEEEERRKQQEAERRKEELLALRAKDPKANKRIQTMLKRTKSANKSVMEDAVDKNNTADTLAGPAQPDEDDYGFVSETSSQLYNKLIQKMYSTPSDNEKKFAPSKKPNSTNLLNTKERVKLALLKQEEEEKLPHKRSRKSKKGEENEEEAEIDTNTSDSGSNEKEKKDKLKPRKPMPPPVDFHELLKIAEQKQHEPIVFEVKKKPQEPEVLMTKKQKLEHEKMQEWKRRKELRAHGLDADEKPEPEIPSKATKKTPKAGQTNCDQKAPKCDEFRLNISNNKSSVKISDKSHGDKSYGDKLYGDKSHGDKLYGDKCKSAGSSDKANQKSRSQLDKKVGERTDADRKFEDDETARLKKERDEVLRLLKEKERLIREREEEERRKKEKEKLIRERDEAIRKLKEREEIIKERDEAIRKLKLLEKSDTKNTKNTKSHDVNSNCKIQKPNVSVKNSLISSGKSSSSQNVKNVANIPTNSKLAARGDKLGDKNSKPREFPPRDVQRGKRFPPADVRRKLQPVKKRRIDSDEEEYDSELDDFIDDNDDGELRQEDVSRAISEIFRYDKNKYSRYDDEDDECMESNYAQISREEYISLRCGIEEDLEDMERENRNKKAKLAKKKKR